MKSEPTKFLASRLLILAAITSLLISGAHARTWTSADGARTFVGEFLSYDPATGLVGVTMAGGNAVKFSQDKLSAADIAFLKERITKPTAPSSGVLNLKGVPDVWPPTNEKPYTGKKLKAEFTADLKSLKEEIYRALPRVGSKAVTDLENAGKATAAALAKADAAQKGLGEIAAAKGLIDHAKGKWIGGANKSIADAQAALKKAKTAAEKDAAQNQLAAAQKSLAEGEAALKERTALYEKTRANESSLKQAHETAQAALTQARATEAAAAKSLMGSMSSFLESDKLDGKLAKAYVLTAATPDGLADFAEQSSENAAVVEQLLADGSVLAAVESAIGTLEVM
jgi:hypothetical protein